MITSLTQRDEYGRKWIISSEIKYFTHELTSLPLLPTLRF